MVCRIITYYLFISITLMSCVSNRGIRYIDDKKSNNLNTQIFENQKLEYRIQSNDVLLIDVQSTDPEISAIFNINQSRGSNLANQSSLFISGYSVDHQGYINLPIVGKISVRNLTLFEVQNIVQKSIDEYLKNATVIIKLVSFRITVLGETRNPGHFFVNNEQATIFEAVGLAGDITEFGNRKEVQLIRQLVDGSEVVQLDLTDPNVISSKYYYLLPNDVIYVPPLKSKAKRSNLQPLTVGLSAASTLILLLNFISNN